MPAPAPVHQQFTDEQKQQVVEWFTQGLTQVQIAEKLSQPRRTIMKLCKHLGLERTTKETARLSAKSPWEHLTEEIKSLRADHSLPEISEKLGVPISSLHRLCVRHEIPLPNREFYASKIAASWTPEKRSELAKRSRELATPELRELIRQSSKDLWQNPEYRAKQIKIQTDIWNTPENRERLAQFRAKQSGRASSIQKTLYSMLDDLKVEYEPEFIVGPYNFDCKVGNILIECQGDYWHSLEKAIRIDKAKASYITSYHQSYQLKYIWEHEFSCQGRVMDTLKYWLGLSQIEVLDFDFSELEVRRAPAEDYKPLLEKHHYLNNAGRGGIAYGAYIGGTIIATCVFSPLIRQNIDTAEFDRSQVVELSRLCIDPKYQKKNLASWFVSRCLKILDGNFKAVISYCDTSFNHDGTTYKALNFSQDKIVRPDYWYADDRGWVMHKKTLYQKAIKMSMVESEYAEKFGYKKVFGTEKFRFIYRR